MIKKFIYGVSVLLCVACNTTTSSSDHIVINGEYKEGDAKALQLSVRPLGGTTYTDAVLLNDSLQYFNGEVPVSETGFYALYGVLNGGQLSVPMYLPKAGKSYDIALKVVEDVPVIDAGRDNKALSAYNQFVYEFGRDFWMNGHSIPLASLQSYIRRYQTVADSIAKAYRCSEAVSDYLQLWAVTSMESLYGSLPRAIGVKQSELDFTKEELLGDATSCYKSAIASCFPSVTHSIVSTLPKGSLNEKLTYLHENYTYPGTLMRVTELVVDGYISKFNYAENYEAGLEELRAAIAKFNLDEKYAEEFAKRRASAKGAPFPTGITLTDKNGQAVDFATFKGKYVYVDLWASWCVPCCREVPHLQKLEKELKNPNVRFVSVSIDTNADSWVKKMDELKMHGVQLLNQDNSLAKAYNVRGIPYFFILDKEGRLYMPNAPRPSHPEIKTLLENLK